MIEILHDTQDFLSMPDRWALETNGRNSLSYGIVKAAGPPYHGHLAIGGHHEPTRQDVVHGQVLEAAGHLEFQV